MTDRADPIAPAAGLAIGEVIGEGGMGVVRSAVQRSLDRQVAVKTTRPDAPPLSAERMLREAWVTGWLEHPGVVPVHDIVHDDAGAPVVVMRRIQGRTWQASMRDVAWAEAQGARDLLEQNLRVLVRVAEIVEFAHAKGVLHRDIKPDNVMLGSFGEVYLLDWGLALALDETVAAHLPRASDVRELSGTLAYIPPEMTGARGAPLDARTDVYLLGAVLFEIAVGHPPHHRATMAATLESIAASPPKMPDDVPRRVAAICARAMRRDAVDRHPDVATFRHEVLDYLRSRDSEHLATAAEKALADLRDACATNAPRRRVYDLYGKCRFGFREALRAWPENEAAARGLSEAAEAMIAHELARDPRVAVALLDEAVTDADPQPNDEGTPTSTRIAVHPPRISAALAEQVRRAAAAEEKEREGLSKLAKEHDRTTGRRARKVVFIAFGIAWALSQLVADRIGPLTHTRFMLGGLLQLPVLGVARLVWPDLTTSKFNRRVVGALAIVFVAQAALYVIGAALAVPVTPLRVLNIALAAMMSAALMVFQESRVWPMTVALVAATGASIAWPDQRPIFMCTALLVVTANIGIVWSRGREP
ncbi:MAG: serine/threonine protein kinase [Deltaproteobacteria bacterium]|nr:serine/threonine protein kinase [Deltaproteobacteria bacterium]